MLEIFNQINTPNNQLICQNFILLFSLLVAYRQLSKMVQTSHGDFTQKFTQDFFNDETRMLITLGKSILTITFLLLYLHYEH